MDCREYRLAALADDPAERAAAAEHALLCDACAAIRDGDAGLLDAVARWKAEAPAPPAYLEHKIAAEIERSAWTATPAARPIARSSQVWFRAAVAALVVLGALSLWGLQQLSGDPVALQSGSDLEQVARDVERLRDEYVGAIARLEAQAAAVLATADDTTISAERVDVLNAYRDRLNHLDAVIADVEGFLDDHAGHAGGHTVLLAALEEKSQLLQEVLAP